jgi:hypothetical protein
MKGSILIFVLFFFYGDFTYSQNIRNDIAKFICHDKNGKLSYFDDSCHKIIFNNQQFEKCVSSDSLVTYNENEKKLSITRNNDTLCIKCQNKGFLLLYKDTSFYINNMNPQVLKNDRKINNFEYDLLFGVIGVTVYFNEANLDQIIIKPAIGREVDINSIYYSEYKSAYNFYIRDSSDNKFFGLFIDYNKTYSICSFDYKKVIGFNIFKSGDTKSGFDDISYNRFSPHESVIGATLIEYNKRGKIEKSILPVYECNEKGPQLLFDDKKGETIFNGYEKSFFELKLRKPN